MAIGQIQTEDDLRAFIQLVLRGSDQAKLVRQLQGGLSGARVVWGGIAAAGGVLNAGSGGWSVSRTALGHYTLTFAPAFASLPAVYTDAVQSLSFPSVPPGVGGVIVFVENGGATAFVDADWWFLAIG